MTVKANISLRKLSLSAEDRCNRIRVITKLFVKSNPILLHCQSTRIGDAVCLSLIQPITEKKKEEETMMRRISDIWGTSVEEMN